ncbi:hypothetical protein E2C01_068580 [Portunus trituberculatus]|uniref:Uncharacterized protein n=1 Tax=Portunus trituberculatus TaxID=210409 RepID=A0A5B7HY89_PORTR|nr:hypothetical protein [Portunus trituberculatus]
MTVRPQCRSDKLTRQRDARGCRGCRHSHRRRWLHSSWGLQSVARWRGGVGHWLFRETGLTSALNLSGEAAPPDKALLERPHHGCLTLKPSKSLFELDSTNHPRFVRHRCCLRRQSHKTAAASCLAA